MGGLVYGLSVHFKIYPIVYCIPFYFFIDCDRKAILEGKKSLCSLLFTNLFTKNRLIFGLVSAGTFLSLTGLFYCVYGYEFIYEGYLYHLIRKDNRHNYSVYWYMILQTYDFQQKSGVMALLAFVPQWAVVIAAGFAFHYDVFFAIVL